MSENEKAISPEMPYLPERTELPGASGQQGGRIPGIALCLLISLAVSTAVLFAYDRWQAQKIVAVDMKGYITLQRYKYRDGKINDEELRKAFDRLEQQMNAIPRNRVVIMADTAIRNAEVFKLGHEEELKQYEELLRRTLQGIPAGQEQ